MVAGCSGRVTLGVALEPSAQCNCAPDIVHWSATFQFGTTDQIHPASEPNATSDAFATSSTLSIKANLSCGCIGYVLSEQAIHISRPEPPRAHQKQLRTVSVRRLLADGVNPKLGGRAPRAEPPECGAEQFQDAKRCITHDTPLQTLWTAKRLSRWSCLLF